MDINIHKKSIRVLLTHEKEIIYILERLVELGEAYPDSDIEKLAKIAKIINDKI